MIAEMPIALPPSLQRDRHPLAEEVAWAKRLSPEERLAVVAALCKDAVTLLNMNAKREVVLTMRDQVPESTNRALARLRLTA
jgi:hypothetical protein